MATGSSEHLSRGKPALFEFAGNPLQLGLDRPVSRREVLIGCIAGTAAMLTMAALQREVLPQSEATSHRASGWSPYPATTAPISMSSVDPDLFAALVGEHFTVTAASQTATLVLLDVVVSEAAGERPREVRQEGFSLIFEVIRGEFAESSIVAIEHEHIGRHDLFLHRVGLMGATAPRYEAIFN